MHVFKEAYGITANRQVLHGTAAESQSLEQFRKGNVKGGYDLVERPQARLSGSALQVGDVDLMDAGVLRKVNLPPIPGEAQLPDTFSRRSTDVLCHDIMFGLVYALYLAYALILVHPLSWIRKASKCAHGQRFPLCCLLR